MFQFGPEFLNIVLEFGPELLKFVAEGAFEVFFGDQPFIKVGLPFGEDFGLVLGHADLSQAFDEGVGIESGGLSLHERQNSGWDGGLQVAVARSWIIRGLCGCG